MVFRLIRNAFRQIGRQPFRTLLVLQGVIWGTALGVLPPALIHGSMKQAEEDATSSGIDRIVITLERRRLSDAFEWEDVELIREKYQDRFRQLNAYATLQMDGESILAVSDGGLAGRALTLTAGRDFNAAEISGKQPAAMIDDQLAAKRFTGDPIGQEIKLGKLTLKVVGVVSGGTDGKVDEFGYKSGHAMSRFINGIKKNIGAIEGDDVKRLRTRKNIMIPRRLLPDVRPNIIEMRADPKIVLDLRDELRSDLVSAGYQPVIYTNALLPVLYRTTLDTFVELNRAVFFLCIMVGTSVVCVLMVLSVVERQREIAIRRVEGARQWHVALQFVVETGTICLVGALLGVLVGCGLAALRVWLEPLQAVTWAFPPVESLVMVAIVSGVGLIGGLLPAWRAVCLDPVEVLRNE
ncbi:MAG: ABC transporter permease [Verrucomicrobiia bacterium]|jgi:putative ABC transport system permease protein